MGSQARERELLRLTAISLASAVLTLLVFVIGGASSALGIPVNVLAGHFLAIVAVYGVCATILRARDDFRALAAAFYFSPVCLAVFRELPSIGWVALVGVVAAALLAAWLFARYATVRGVPPVAAAAGAAHGAAFVAFATAPRDLYAWLVMVLWTFGAVLIAASAGFSKRTSYFQEIRGASLLAILSLAGVAFFSVDRAHDALISTALSVDAGDRPSVILVVLDTVRADHLELYGYERETMPNLARFAREDAVVVARSVSNGSNSGSSHGSLFTGLYPPRHGAHAPVLEDLDPPGFIYPLRTDVPTLAEIFTAAGYWTVGIASNYAVLGSTYGLDRGFMHHEADPEPGCWFVRYSPWRPVLHMVARFSGGDFFACPVPYRRAHEITDRALATVAATGERPFFLFLNYLDAHTPYTPPGDFPDRFAGRDTELGSGEIRQALRNGTMRGEREITPLERTHFEALYDGELAYLDVELQRLIDGLRAAPNWQDIVVAITSDHGEAFGEHRFLTHSNSLYEEAVSVPLIVKPGAGASPGVSPGSEFPGPVQSVDLFATLLDFAGIEPPKQIDGVVLGQPRNEVRSWVYAWNFVDARIRARCRLELRSIEIDGWKLIESTNDNHELYNLLLDPGEQNNLFEREVEMGELLSDALGPREPYRLFFRAGVNAESDETMNRLRALGYVR